MPTDEEWQTLVDYLGGSFVAGGKLKEIGTDHWETPNIGATNESGFSALPGGCRLGNGIFNRIGDLACFWSATESSGNDAWFRILSFNDSDISRYYYHKRFGLSVRCVKD